MLYFKKLTNNSKNQKKNQVKTNLLLTLFVLL